MCPQQMLRTWANGETFVLATMCPRLSGPLLFLLVKKKLVSIKTALAFYRDNSPLKNHQVVL